MESGVLTRTASYASCSLSLWERARVRERPHARSFIIVHEWEGTVLAVSLTPALSRREREQVSFCTTSLAC